MSNYPQTPGYGQNPQNNMNRPINPQAGPQPQPQPGAYQWPHMTLGNWIVTFLLMLIPIANIVLMFVWAFGSSVNPSKKTYFQASLIMALIGVGLSILLGGVITAVLASAFSTFS